MDGSALLSSKKPTSPEQRSTHLSHEDERLDLLVALYGKLGFGEPRRRPSNVLVDGVLRVAREHLFNEHELELLGVLLDGLGDGLRSESGLGSVSGEK